MRFSFSATRRALRCQQGQTIVEFALVLPLMLALMFGIIDMSKAFNYWNDLNQIAGEGARMAAVNRETDGASLQEYLEDQADSGELKAGIDVCIALPEGETPGSPVRVEATHSYEWLPIVSNLTGIDTATELSGTATMRLEATPDFVADC